MKGYFPWQKLGSTDRQGGWCTWKDHRVARAAYGMTYQLMQGRKE